MKHRLATALKWPVCAFGLAAAAYTAYVGTAWLRYGQPRRAKATTDEDELLDRFMPEYEVVDRQSIHISARPDAAFRAACDSDLMYLPFVRAIFATRAFILRSPADTPEHIPGLIAFTKSQGWSVLAELPGREIVMGTATRPWEAKVVFRSLAPDEFAAFDEPGFVKIAWTLRADTAKTEGTKFRTETRAMTTDDTARRKFRWYWAVFSPGIVLIRRLMLKQLRTEAESLRQPADVIA